MKKLKKYTLFFLCISIVFLISINIFVVLSHNSLSTKVENLSVIKSKISSLDTFKTIIVNLGHSQKFYLLSFDENYKVKYNNYLSDAYDSLDKLSESNSISDSYKETLTTMLKEYDDINLKLLGNKVELPLNDEMQGYLAKSNEIQINIMHSISTAISSNRDTTSENQSSLSTSINKQKNIIQGLSSFFTVVLGGPAYYIFKKYKNGEIQLDDILNVLEKEKIKVDNYSNIITFASILNNHNKEMKKQWIEVRDKIELLQKSISDLKIKAINCDVSVLPNFNSEMQAMEIQLLEIKLLVKQLPDYHEFIISLTDSMINTEKNSKD